MSESYEPFYQTIDLYLEMLRDAQRIEDRKLIRLIRRRLKHVRQAPVLTPCGCEVIFFPRAAAPCPAPIVDLPFWPRRLLRELFVLAAGYALLIVTHTIF
ncbi:MAG: hypothetical protein QNJ48_11065 [Desulfobacterales bacterium]|nr:hypothetical protein [Desulfobacterales bacterium]MDJ0884695.1 hypothetical protein [Desulfobacterales bacterium]